jgi:death on curing protein
LDDEPLWLDLDEILESQAEQLALFGGPPGIRDIGLIESALIRPQNMYYYEGVDDLLTLAVRLGVGIAENHGFIDGNKRTGAVAMIELLAINGYFLDIPNDTTLGALFEAAVTGRMTEEELVEDLYAYVEPLSDDPS